MKNQIIVAMDMEIEDGIELVSQISHRKEIYGYKVGSLWILEKGIKILIDVEKANDGYKKIILDMQKWGTDIPDIVKKQVEKVAPYVDELICCPMGAGSESLKMFSKTCLENNVKPVCVLEMTHNFADKYLKNNSKGMIVEDCYNCGVKSFVLPSTKEQEKALKALFEFYYGKNVVNLYATGFKTQGGQVKPMIDFGVTKFIVGRAIYEAQNPIQSIEDIYKEINEV